MGTGSADAMLILPILAVAVGCRFCNKKFDFQGKNPKLVGEIHLGGSHDSDAVVGNVDDGDLPHNVTIGDQRSAFRVCAPAPDESFYFICESYVDCIQWKGFLTAWIDADVKQRVGDRQDDSNTVLLRLSSKVAGQDPVEVAGGKQQATSHPIGGGSASRSSNTWDACLQIAKCVSPPARHAPRPWHPRTPPPPIFSLSLSCLVANP